MKAYLTVATSPLGNASRIRFNFGKAKVAAAVCASLGPYFLASSFTLATVAAIAACPEDGNASDSSTPLDPSILGPITDTELPDVVANLPPPLPNGVGSAPTNGEDGDSGDGGCSYCYSATPYGMGSSSGPSYYNDPIHEDSLDDKLGPALSQVSDDINLRLADKQQTQVDYVSAGAAPLQVARVYHSNTTTYAAQTTQPVGTGWHHYYDRSLQVVVSGSSVRLHRANGMVLAYGWNGSAWTSTSPGGTLTQQGSGWQYVNTRNVVEAYDSTGRLTSMTEGGLATTMQYDGSGHLTKVSNPFGRALNFGYDGSGRLSNVTLPNSSILVYSYDSYNNLVSTRFADSSVRQYVYEDTAHRNALTGVIDESGKRVLTWTYDSSGRPNHGHSGAGVAAVDVTYNGDTVTSTDARGVTRTRNFSTVGGRRVLMSLQTAASSAGPATTASFSYDSAGNLSGATMPSGEVQVIGVDAHGRLLNRTRASGSSTPLAAQHTWSGGWRVPTQTISQGVTTNRTLDALGRVTQITETGTDGTTRTTLKRTYNAQQLLATATDANGAVTTFNYDASGNLTSSINNLNQTTTYASFDSHGRATQITRPDGTVITRSYDSRGRISARNVAGINTSYAYDNANRLTKVTFADGSWTSVSYDSSGLPSGTSNHRGESTVITRDVAGQETGRSSYNAAGQLAQSTHQQYDLRGRLSTWMDSRGYATTVNYGSDGRVASVTDPLSRNRSQTLDLLNRTTTVTIPNTSAARLTGGPATVSSSMNFHPTYGRLSSAADTVNVSTTYGYDAFNRRAADTGPDAGARSWTLTPGGSVATFTDTRGIVTTITRDNLNRITQLAPSTGTATTITYVTGRTDNLPATTTDEAGTTNRTYDSAGRLLTKAVTYVGSGTRTLTLTRDSLGRVTGMTYPSGLQVGYTYDADHVSTVTVAGVAVISNVTYAPGSNTITGWHWSSGANYSRSYNADGRVAQVTLGPVTRTYAYDAGGRVQSQTDVGGAFAGTSNYSFDEAGQLTGYTPPTGSATTYGYDSNGNRKYYALGTATTSYTYVAGTNRITTSPNGSYTYDSVGNPTSDGYYGLTYDGYGRMTQLLATNDYKVVRTFNAQGLRLSSVASTYIGLGGAALSANQASVQQPVLAPLHASLRSQAASNTSSSLAVPNAGPSWVVSDSRQYFYDDSGQILGEYIVKGSSAQQETVWLNGQPVAAVIGGVTYLVSADRLGTPRSLQKASDGTEVWHWDGEPFGNTYPNPHVVEYNLRFAGQLYDWQTGYYYNWMRDYNQVDGRFMQPDPVGLQAGLSRYTYVSADPLNSVDANGLASTDGPPLPAISQFANLFRGISFTAPSLRDNLNNRVLPSYNFTMQDYGNLIARSMGLGGLTGSAGGMGYGFAVGTAEAVEAPPLMGGAFVADAVYSGTVLGTTLGLATTAAGAIIIGGVIYYNSDGKTVGNTPSKFGPLGPGGWSKDPSPNLTCPGR